MRAQNANFKILYVPGSKVWHKVSLSTGGSSSAISRYYSIRNLLSCLDMNKPLPFPARTLRYCIIFCTMFLSLFTGNVPKKEGARYLLQGIMDYFDGKFGEWTNANKH
jgi:GT2 family glycosyltransferase